MALEDYPYSFNPVVLVSATTGGPVANATVTLHAEPGGEALPVGDLGGNSLGATLTSTGLGILPAHRTTVAQPYVDAGGSVVLRTLAQELANSLPQAQAAAADAATSRVAAEGAATSAADSAATVQGVIIDASDAAVSTVVSTAGSATRVALTRTGARPVGQGEPGLNGLDHGISETSDDNTAAINDFLTLLGSSFTKGRQGYLPAGRYRYAGKITVPSGVIWRGDGQRLWVTGATPEIKHTGTMLVPTTPGAVIAIEGTSGSSLTHVEASQLRDLTIDGASATEVGVQVTNAFDITLSDVFIRACVTGIKVATTTSSDFVENLRLRDVKITNGTVAVDSTGSATKGFIDSTGLHIRNMSQAGVRGAWTGTFSGGFLGRIGTADAGDGIGFDLVGADGVVISGVPFENTPRPVRVSGASYAVEVTGCVTNSSSASFGLVTGVDIVSCDGWVVTGNKFLYTNSTAAAAGVVGASAARYGLVAGNVYQGAGAKTKVSIANPALNAVNVEGRWSRVDTDALFIGTGTAATTAGIGGAAGFTRSLLYYTGQAGVTTGRRWDARVSAGAESGSNAGSDYEIVSYDDAGAGTAVRARVRRSDGRFTTFGPLQTAAYTTAARPSAATAGVGSLIFDSTLNKPIWSTGSTWVDAAGVTV